MTRIRTAILALFSLCCLAAACSNNGGTDGGTDAGAQTVNGIVSDIGTGARISGATVTGGGRSTITDQQGEFTLSGLAVGSVNLAISKSDYAPGYATAKASDKPQAVLVWLKKQGTAQAYAVTLSEKTEAGPYAVIFQPNSLDTNDTNLKVAITPLDPTKERQALPGSLVSGGADPSLLLPVTFAEFTILDSAGNRVGLKPSASAVVELPIPPSLRSTYPPSTKIHCYAYDSTSGAWQDFVEGTVQTSSVDNASPVLAASVRHFSWYGGAPQGNNCVDVYVTVVSAVDGKPLPNARVEANPGTVAYTDGEGSALVRSAIGVPGSTYTAYQTGYDVDGSLTGIPGAKYIEFGEVQEDVVGLVRVPCNGSSAFALPANAGRAALAVGSQGNPLLIKVGLVKNLLYEAEAALVSGQGGSGGSLFVILSQGVPGPDGKITNPIPASGAKIYLTEAGQQPIPLTEVSAGTGFYTSTTPLSINAGKSYTLAIDGDGNGSVDGSARIVAVGDLAWSNPTDGAIVAAADLTASWTDTGTSAGNSSYAPVYQVTLASSEDFAFYSGTDRQFAVMNNRSALKPGAYSGALVGFSGFYAGAGGGLQLSKNITGSGVTGTFFSVATPSPISFTVK